MKLFKPPLRFWRTQGIPIVIFVDDGLGGVAHELAAKINSLRVNTDLVRLGFVDNGFKSTNGNYLAGHCFRHTSGTIAVTNERLKKLKMCIKSILKCESRIVKVRELAALIGQIISLSPGVGNLTTIMTRSMYADCQ